MSCLLECVCIYLLAILVTLSTHSPIQLLPLHYNLPTTGSQTAVAYLTGTSMAAPHVAGVAAILHSQGEYQLSSEEVEFELLNISTQNVISNVPNETMDGVPGTPNLLVFVQPCGTDGPGTNSMSVTAKSIRTTMNFLSVGFVLIICFNFGLQTTPKAVKDISTNKWKFLLILVVQAMAVPLLCLIFTKSLQMHYAKMMTVFFVSLFPGGVVSNLIFVQPEERNFRLSTVVSFLQNIFAVVTIPLVFSILWTNRPDDISASDISWVRLFIMMLSMLFLSLLGLIVRSYMSESSTKSALSILRDLSTAISVFVLLLVLLLYIGKLMRASLGLWVAAILVQLGCGFAGVMTAVLFNSKASECITVGTEFAFRNCFLAIGVIAFTFGGDTREDMFVFTLIYSFVSSLLVLITAPMVKCCSCCSSKGKRNNGDNSASDLDAGLIYIHEAGRSDAVPSTTVTTATGASYSY